MRGWLIVLSAALAGSCSKAPVLPALADTLPDDVKAAQVEFDRRVQATFPVGMSNQRVIDTLQHDGFTVGSVQSGARRTAELLRHDGVCNRVWFVDWQSAGGKVTQMQGITGLQCP